MKDISRVPWPVGGLTRRSFLTTLGAAGVIVVAPRAVPQDSRSLLPQSANSLESSFQAPSHTFRAWTYWWWLEGGVTKVGITADLEAMKQQGIAGELPRKAPKALRPLRHGAHFWLTDAQGRVLLRRRAARGLLGGMTELPGTDWLPEPWSKTAALAAAPMPAPWRAIHTVRHGFTHFELHIVLYSATVPVIAADGFLRDADMLEDEALPSVMRKCVAAARKAG